MQSLRIHLISVTIAILFMSCSASSPGSNPSGPKPEWLKEYPVSPTFYVGVGSAAKTGNHPTTMRSAQDLALADLASQISVTISSEIITTLIEKGDITRDEYLATARSQAVADLEGHEFVDSWEDSEYHYAYYRLSKMKYAEIQSRKRRAAIDLALDFRQKAITAEEQRDYSVMFTSLIQAFTPLIPYLNEALEVEVDGESIILSNDLSERIQMAVYLIPLLPDPLEVKGKLGQPIKERLTIVSSGILGPLKNVPLKIVFKKGAGSMTELTSTGKDGVAELKVYSITSMEQVQWLEIQLDVERLLPEDLSPILRAVIESVSPAKTNLTIELINPTIYMVSSELFGGNSLRQAQVEPILKNHFVTSGYHFVDNQKQADWQITLKASALQGTEYSGLYTAFADVNVSVTDLSSGEEIFKNSLKRVKGIDLSYEAAGNKALSNAATRMSETILPEILEQLGIKN